MTEDITVKIPAGIQRHLNDMWDAAVEEYNKRKKNKEERVHLCYNRRDRVFWVNVLFTREFLEFKNVTVII